MLAVRVAVVLCFRDVDAVVNIEVQNDRCAKFLKKKTKTERGDMPKNVRAALKACEFPREPSADQGRNLYFL